MKVKVTYIISNIDKALTFEWISTHLNVEKYALSFILLNPEKSYLEDYLTQNHIPVYRIDLESKKDYPRVLFQLYKILKTLKPDIIHTHLREADILGQITSWLLRIPKRIMTRHYSTLNQVYYPKGVKWDKFIQRFPTHIVAISGVVKDALIEEGVPENKIRILPHGIDIESFSAPNSSIVNQLKEKYNPLNKNPVIGFIARYVELKGHRYVIEAFSKLLVQESNALLIFANASGPLQEEIGRLLQNNLPELSFIEIPFEKEIQSLYHLFDVFIHIPTDPKIEAFGQTYVEALAAGIPSIFTMSGIAHEFIIHENNAIVVPYKNAEAIFAAINKILIDTDLRERLIHNGYQAVHKIFGLDKMINKLEQLYDE